MGQPVKLSDALVTDARIAAATMQRSIARQVEHWAQLGRVVEGFMTGHQLTDLNRAEVVKAIYETDTPKGRAEVKEALANGPYPRYTPYPHDEDLLIREDSDGKTTVGRFKEREFVAVKLSRKRAAA